MNPKFPVTHSFLSTQALTDQVLPDYDLPAPLECAFYNMGLNDTYLVKTGSESYILRVYRAGWRSEADIYFELEALLHLKERGVPVSYPLLRKDGALIRILNAPEGPRPAALFTFAQGDNPTYEEHAEEQACLYGKGMASIHAATEGFTNPHTRFALDFRHLLDEPLQAVEPFLRHRPEDWAYLTGLAERLREKIEGISPGTLDTGFCHGDFHGWNAHLRDGQFTFFDFDCCGMGWRAYDIAVFRWGQRINGGKEKTLWPKFLEGYREIRPLADIDLQLTWDFVAVRNIWLLGLHTAASKDWGQGWLDEAYFDRAVKFFKDWEKDK